MTTTSCRVINTHESYLKEVNIVRKELWENVYNNFINMSLLTRLIYNTFPEGSINTLDYDFENNTIKIVTNTVLANTYINSYMLNAIFQFINILYNNKTITDKQYEICGKRLTMLFNLTLNNDFNIEIKL